MSSCRKISILLARNQSLHTWDISILIFIHAMRNIFAGQKFITHDHWMMATTYLITPGAYTFAAAAIYGWASGATGNGRRTRRWAMLRSVERRRGASDENELFGCRLSFAADAKQIQIFKEEEKPAENWRRTRKDTRDEEPEATAFVFSYYITFPSRICTFDSTHCYWFVSIFL